MTTRHQTVDGSDGTNGPSSRRPNLPGWLPPAAVAVVVAAAAYAWNPDLVTSTLTTPRAVAFIAIVVGVVIGVGRLLGPRRPVLARVIQLVLVLAVFAVTVVPTVRNTEIDEKLDVVTTDSSRATGTGSPDAGGSAAPASGAAVLAEGEVRKLDYRASGRARLIEKADKTRIVRFEDLDVQPGPDYFVYLVPKSDADHPRGGVSLGRLKANKGNQNYAVPAQTKLGADLTVLIWCRSFAAPVANATLT